MKKTCLSTFLLCAVLTAGPAAQRPAGVVQFELKHAEKDVPELAAVLELQRGMTVADVGAGGGAMTLFMARHVGPAGRVYATDIGATQLDEIRQLVSDERLENVTVLEGAEQSTNLPERCCDAVFLQDVYHHLTRPSEINRSLLAALKPGGRLAVIDFEPKPGSKLPDGVPANRRGHGIPVSVVVDEVRAAGFTYVLTNARWPPNASVGDFFLTLFRKP